jgi:hypothetical protein
MTMPGTGGLPPRRADQVANLAPPTQASGGAAGTVRARIVIVSGTNEGVFVYNGAPGTGTLLASLVGQTTTDPFGNPVQPNGLTIYNGTQSAFLGIASPLGVAEVLLRFLTGASFEATNGGLEFNYAQLGSGATAFLSAGILGPQASGAGATDSVSISLDSATENGSSGASGTIGYFDTGGTFHAWATWNSTGFNILQGSFTGNVVGTVNGIGPTTGTVTAPGAAAGNPPNGAGTASASTVAGALLSYFDALATTYNTTQAATNNLVNLMLSWGV